MRPLVLIGVLLVIVGIAGLAFNGFTYTTRDEVAKVGPLEATAEHDHNVFISPYAGIAAIVIGGVLILAGRRRI
jgi:uncharacterized membrane protein